MRKIFRPKNPADYFNDKFLNVRIRKKLLKSYDNFFSIKNFILNFILNEFPKTVNNFDNLYFEPTKQKITRFNSNFLKEDICKFIRPKKQLKEYEEKLKIWRELAKEYREDWVYCEEREIKTTYIEKAKFEENRLKKFTKDWEKCL